MPEICKHYKECKTCRERKRLLVQKLNEVSAITEINYVLSVSNKTIEYKYTILYTLIRLTNNNGLHEIIRKNPEITIGEIIKRLEKDAGF